jgi:ribosomal protein S18 acetylase RimI-like enzyme
MKKQNPSAAQCHDPNCCHHHDCVVRIRLYQPRDYRALREIWQAGHIHMDDRDSAQSLARNIKERKNGYRIFTVELEMTGHNGRSTSKSAIAAGAIVTFDGHRAHLYHFAVHPDFRGLGIGRALLETCEHQARQWGARQMRLTARSDGSRAVAQHIYESSGWIHEEDIWMYRKDLRERTPREKLLSRGRARAK